MGNLLIVPCLHELNPWKSNRSSVKTDGLGGRTLLSGNTYSHSPSLRPHSTSLEISIREPRCARRRCGKRLCPSQLRSFAAASPAGSTATFH